MPRSVTVSEAQQQILEVAFEIYRICYRLHILDGGLRVPPEIENDIYGGLDADSAPATLELSVSGDIVGTTEDLEGLADRLRKTAHDTDTKIRRAWRQRLEEQQPTPRPDGHGETRKRGER